MSGRKIKISVGAPTELVLLNSEKIPLVFRIALWYNARLLIKTRYGETK
jgi:hypothetical protein